MPFFPHENTTRKLSQKLGKYVECHFSFLQIETKVKLEMFGKYIKYEICVGKFSLNYSKYRLDILWRNLYKD